jgi:hypothetical protein
MERLCQSERKPGIEFALTTSMADSGFEIDRIVLATVRRPIEREK